MNLTEPGAGSDLAAIRGCRAEPTANGAYRLYGQKSSLPATTTSPRTLSIWFSLELQEHRRASEASHAFWSPSFSPDAMGRPGARNDVQCVSLEHKLGIHGSPTAVLAFGDREGARAVWSARKITGLPNHVHHDECRPFQRGPRGTGRCRAVLPKGCRLRPRASSGYRGGSPGWRQSPHFASSDVRRMLMSMRSRIEAIELLLTWWRAGRGGGAPDAGTALLAPSPNCWSRSSGVKTENAIDIPSLGIQIHGGTGYIEGTGPPNISGMRDWPSTRGRTAIQANDLAGRKLVGMAVPHWLP